MLQPSLYIDGQWSVASGELFNKVNLATNTKIQSSSAATEEDVKPARCVFLRQAKTSLEERIGYLDSFCTELADAKIDLANTIGQETGKPLTEVQAMINKVQISITAYQERNSDNVTELADG